MVEKDGKTEIRRCSFCNKDEKDVRKLIAGPTAMICDECVETCNDIITDTPLKKGVQRIYRGRIFTVIVETMTLPKGGRLAAEIIRHPGSVVIIPVTAGGEIVLVRQYRPALDQWVWELPAGSLRPGEDVNKAALRECHEEIGLIPSRLERLGSFFPTPGYCDEEMNFYRADGLREATADDEAAHQDEDEDIEAQAFSAEEIDRMIAAGEIIDLKTVAGLALLK